MKIAKAYLRDKAITSQKVRANDKVKLKLNLHVKRKGLKFLSTGLERDKQTGWDYRQTRYHDADLGRFLAVDPHHFNYLNWSSYHYAAANPVSITDPTGKDWFKEHSTGAVLWRDSKDKTYSRSFIDDDGVEVHECYDNIGEQYLHSFPQLEGYISFQGNKPGNFVFRDEIMERLSKLPSNQVQPESKIYILAVMLLDRHNFANFQLFDCRPKTALGL